MGKKKVLDLFVGNPTEEEKERIMEDKLTSHPDVLFKIYSKDDKSKTGKSKTGKSKTGKPSEKKLCSLVFRPTSNPALWKKHIEESHENINVYQVGYRQAYVLLINAENEDPVEEDQVEEDQVEEDLVEEDQEKEDQVKKDQVKKDQVIFIKGKKDELEKICGNFRQTLQLIYFEHLQEVVETLKSTLEALRGLQIEPRDK